VRLSVIVISYHPGWLGACLRALVDQPQADEIIVSDCSGVDPAPALAGRFPRVRFLHFDKKRSVPELRWAALPFATGEIVASLEARSIPAADWCDNLVRGHLDYPAAPAVGGPIALATPASPRDWGLYFSEYGRLAPPMRSGPTAELSGANVSYKRADLDAARDLIDAGRWDTLLHDRWRAQGRSLVLTPATVYFRHALDSAAAFRQRFAYGRGYAATRVEALPIWRRLLYAAGCGVLPALLTVRLARSLRSKGLLYRFWRGILWLVAFNAVWAAGEMSGYLFGQSRRVEIY
jgi:hypothetical protein